MKILKVEHYDNEISQGNGVIVTLHYGCSFEHGCHEGVRGFDTIDQADQAIKDAWPCNCDECRAH